VCLCCVVCVYMCVCMCVRVCAFAIGLVLSHDILEGGEVGQQTE